MKKLAFILLLLGLHGSPAAGSATTNWTTVAVMPFHNTRGDKALDLWREEFAAQVSYWLGTAQPFKFEVVADQKVRSALASHGWKGKKQVALELAEKAARELHCSTVILGEFSRADGVWRAKIHIVRLGSAASEQTLQAQDRSVHALQIRLWQQTCAALEVTPYPAAVATALAYPLSDSTMEKLARLKEPKTRDAARGYVKAVRTILASEPNCLHARTGLARGLIWLRKPDEAAAEGRRIVQQAPDLCSGHLVLAMSLEGAEHDKEREQEFLAALKAHPGCPSAIRLLFDEWAGKERWADLRKVCEEAHGLLPAEKSTTASLAATLANLGEREASSALLSELDATRDDDPRLHAAILLASITGTNPDLQRGAREMLWFQRHQTNDTARHILSQVDQSFYLVLTEMTNAPAPPPTCTPQQLQAELNRRLTPAERRLAVSPIAVTKEIRATANQLTRGLTNAQVKLAVVFAYVAEQRQNDALAAEQSHTNAPERVCHSYASHFVALAHAVGIPAWLVHVDLITDELSGSHDRAAVMLAGRFVQCDPTWGYLCMSWDPEAGQSRVLNDLQAIAHHLCQSSLVPSLKAGLKLDPDDAWTRDVCALHLAQMHQVREAEEVLKGLPPESTNRWDYHLARGLIEAEREDYEAARRTLHEADKLGPNNPTVKQALGLVYGSLKEHRKSQEYLEKAMELRAALYLPRDRHDSDTPDATTVSLDTLRARARAGDKTARVVLVNRLFKLGNSECGEALGLLREVAEAGDAIFQQNYGRNLLLLRGPEAAAEAATYLRKAAEQGYADAQYQLGLLLYEGKLVRKDDVEASQWVHLAAAQGNNNARILLREMQLFVDNAAFEEGRKRAQSFKPAPPQAREAAARQAEAAGSASSHSEGKWTSTGNLVA
jgi:TPR repeat protein